MTSQAGAPRKAQDGAELPAPAHRDPQQGTLDPAENALQNVLASFETRAKALRGLGIIAAQGGQWDDAIGSFQQAFDVAPDLVGVRENLIHALSMKSMQLTQNGRLEEADGMLRSARDLVTGDDGSATYRATLGYRFADLGFAMGRQTGDTQIALDTVREGRALNWDDTILRLYLDEALRVSGLPARLSDYTDKITETELGKHLLIACFPKSGSTFLKNILVEITGFPHQNLAYSHGKNDTGIYLPDLIYSATQDTVTQIHLRPTDSNLSLMQGFLIRPIVLVRNIFDVLLSYKEFYDNVYRELSFYDHYGTLDETQRFDLIIDDRAAWYIGFFAGWQRAIRERRIEGFWLSYEQLMQDKAGKVEEILKFYGLDRPRQAIADAIEKISGNKEANRFNKGVAGRGESSFNDDQKTQIKRIAAYHPDIDFSLIGL